MICDNCIHKDVCRDAYVADEELMVYCKHYEPPRKRGDWVNCANGNAQCNQCGMRQRGVYDDDNEQRFCGHCGAEMSCSARWLLKNRFIAMNREAIQND